MAVDRQRRIGFVALEHQVDGPPRRRQRRVVERALPVHGRVAGRHQQRVALAQRHVQPFGQPQHHLSYIETGRSLPSREMILRLADRLDVPLRERNSLLTSAGFAPMYPERPLADPAMTPRAT